MFYIFNKEIPESPGVYIMKKKGDIIYIGKAKKLDKRVSSYFNGSNLNSKTQQLVNNIDDLDFIICNSETDALILENNLIKKYKPKYNINLKDSKGYPYFFISKEQFPKVILTKNSSLEETGYIFGPFPSNLRKIHTFLCNFFKIRDCKRDMSKLYPTPCLKYHMNRCFGPCIKKDIETEYNENLKNLKSILRGNRDIVVSTLKEKMLEAAENMEFEKAISFREQIKIVESRFIFQISETNLSNDEDVFLVDIGDNFIFLYVLKIREGKISDNFFTYLSLKNKIFEDIFLEVISNFYSKNYLPKTIYFQKEFECYFDSLNNLFKALFNKNVKCLFPKIKSRGLELLKMGENNLKKEISLFYNKKENLVAGLNSLYKNLKLKYFPYRIECFDISNTQGTNPVASMSVSIEGKAAKNEYRKFKIKCKNTPDDFLMMKEAIFRRYSKLPKEEFPNLILIDGGLGQLNAVAEILRELEKLQFCDLISIAKKEEEIFSFGSNIPFIFSKDSEALKILQRVRDEAHRFGITFHRKLRSKRVISSELDNIPGIGPKRKQLLLSTFGSVENIKNTEIDRLKAIIPKSVALKIKEYFNKGGQLLK